MLEAKTVDSPNVGARPRLVKSAGKDNPSLSKVLVDGLVTITPELAVRIIRQCGYERQRPIRLKHVEVLAGQMRRREWTSGTQIHFGRLPDGMLVLLNGNHRIHAVAKADTAVPFQVLVTDVANMDGLRSLYRRHDRLYAGRTVSDALMAEGVPERFALRRDMAGACFRAVAVIDSRFRGGRHADPYLVRSDEHRLRAADDWWPTAVLYQDAIVRAPFAVKHTMQRAGVAAVALVTLRYQEAKADAFWRGLANNDGLREGDPRRAYLGHLMVPRPRSDVQAAKTVALAWNAFYRDRELSLIRLGAGPLTILGTPYARPPKD